MALLGSSTKTANLTAGMLFARERLREVIEKEQYWPVPPDLASGIYTTDSSSQTRFFSRVSSVPVSASPPEYRGGYFLTVDVWWWNQAPGQARAGQGILSTRTSQFLYPGVTVP